MQVADTPSRGDIVRGLIGAVSIGIVLALTYQPAVKLFAPKVILFVTISVFCVATAKSKAGVLAGILCIIIFRLLIGGIFLRT